MSPDYLLELIFLQVTCFPRLSHNNADLLKRPPSRAQGWACHRPLPQSLRAPPVTIRATKADREEKREQLKSRRLPYPLETVTVQPAATGASPLPPRSESHKQQPTDLKTPAAPAWSHDRPTPP